MFVCQFLLGWVDVVCGKKITDKCMENLKVNYDGITLNAQWYEYSPIFKTAHVAKEI